jgi:hypothetical protein
MSIADIVIQIPWYYFLISIVFSLYYAVRGIVWMKKYGDKTLTHVQKIIIEYIQEFLFKVVCTISSFMTLVVANYIFSSLKSINEIGVGTAVLLIFLFIWGITGVSGYLTHLIVLGKFPTGK